MSDKCLKCGQQYDSGGEASHQCSFQVEKSEWRKCYLAVDDRGFQHFYDNIYAFQHKGLRIDFEFIEVGALAESERAMSEREKLLITLLKFLQEESDCLRSVLSEWENDKSRFVQMNRADIIRAAIETLEFEV